MKLQLALLLPLCFACVTVETDSGKSHPGFDHSYGSVVSGDLDTVWGAVTATFTQLGGGAAELDASEHTASALYGGAQVSLRAQRKSANQTILRIEASRDGQEDRRLAEQVLMAVQRRLF